jgi:hypothetical protein
VVSVEQKLIVKNESQCIYLIKETNITFYLMIPNSRHLEIVLAIFDYVDDNFVKNIPVLGDKAIVIPIIQKQVLEQVAMNEPKFITYLDQVLSYLINTSYQILSFNHLEVDSKILLNYNDKYSSFHQKFLANHKERVESFELFPKQELEHPEVLSEGVSSEVEVPLASFDKSQNVEDEEHLNHDTSTHEMGFVSYVLLGVFVAVVSLVFLYLII